MPGRRHQTRNAVTDFSHRQGPTSSLLYPPFAVWAGKKGDVGRRLFVYSSPNRELQFAKVSVRNDGQLLREYQNLVLVGDALRGTELETSIPPHPIFGDSTLVQTWLPGLPVTDLLVRSRRSMLARYRARRVSLTVVRWLARFHAAMRGRVEGPRRLIGGVHGDFKPSNVLIARSGLSVVDWELFEQSADQCFDLFHWTISFGLTCGGALGRSDIERAFVGPSWIARTIRASIAEYFQQRGVAIPNLRDGLNSYAEAVLKRRAGLGFLNEGHFMHDIQQLLCVDHKAPYAFSVDR
jgi:hypothetical protein